MDDDPRAECIWTLDSRRELAQLVAQKPSLCNHTSSRQAADQGCPLFIACLTCALSERSRPTQRRDSIREVWLHMMDRRVGCLQRGLPKNHDSGPRSPQESRSDEPSPREGKAQRSHTRPEQGVNQSESSRERRHRQEGRRRRETVSRHKRGFAIGSEQSLVAIQRASMAMVRVNLAACRLIVVYPSCGTCE